MYTTVESKYKIKDSKNERALCAKSAINRVLKRAFDVAFAVTGLIIAAPVMVIISICIWLESPGNVIFSQERLGLHGRRFRMHKFRKFPAHWRDCGPGITVACDARMTRVGAVLERLKFDELPQLWNILKGEMSFVGPRPESIRFENLFKGEFVSVLEFVPGIFGPNQIAFRNESELYPPDEDPETYYRLVLFPQKAKSDLAYFQKANCLTDAMWIIKGVWVSISGVVNWHRFMGLHAKIVLTDMVVVTVVWTFAHVIRFSGIPEGYGFEIFMTGLWSMPASLVFGLFAGGCYLHPVRYFSLCDAIRLTLLTTITLLVYFLFIVGSYRGMSLYLIPMVWLTLLPLLNLSRILVRMKWERHCLLQEKSEKKIIIYGVGKRGTALASWIGGANLIGFLDDDPMLRGRRVHGYKVLGRESDIPTVYEVHPFDELWVTFTPDLVKRKRLQELCERRNIKLFIISDLEPFSVLVRTTHADIQQCMNASSSARRWA